MNISLIIWQYMTAIYDKRIVNKADFDTKYTKYVQSNPYVINSLEQTNPICEYLTINNKPMLLISVPIYINNKINGRLLVGKYLQGHFLAHLKNITHIDYLNFNKTDIKSYYKKEITNGRYLLKEISKDELMGAFALQSESKKSLVMLEMEMDRNIYKNGLQSIKYFYILIFIACVLLIFTIFFFVEKMVLTHLLFVKDEIIRISQTRDSESRIKPLPFKNKKNEISILVESTNEMLQALDDARRESESIREQMASEADDFQHSLRKLHSVRSELLNVETIDELWQQAVVLGESKLYFNRLSIWLFDEKDKWLIHGTFGIDEDGTIRDEHMSSIVVTPESLMGKLIASEQQIVIEQEDSLLNNSTKEVGKGPHAIASIWNNNKMIGAISTDNLITGQQFTNRQLELLEILAATVSHVYSEKSTSLSLAASENKYRALFKSMSEAFVLFDVIFDDEGTPIDYRFISVNPAYEKYTRRSSDILIGKLITEVYSENEMEVKEKYDEVIQTGTPLKFDYLSPNINKTFQVTVYIPRSGQIAVLFSDITERKSYEDRLNFLAFYDELTGLANRFLFTDRLTNSLSRIQRQGGNLAVMFVDLDRFKEVNDTLGHNIGDILLTEVGKRLKACIRDNDTVGRMGGDEFVFLITDLITPTHAVATAERVVHTLQKPFEIDGHSIFISGSVGITLAPDDGNNVDELMKNADLAMYRAKSQGRNRYSLYSQELYTIVKEKRNTEIELRHALTNSELEVYYQPQVDFHNGKIKGLEALVRWNHPELGMMSPMQFLPVAEETGLITPIGEWVLESACKQVQKWRESGCDDFSIAVNLSPRQFEHESIIDKVNDILMETRLPSRLLELEITEHTAMTDTKYAIHLMNRLHNLGVKIAIDDFGMGYCSFGYLKQMPIDTLKIDHAFVKDIIEDKRNLAIIQAITTLGHQMGMSLIAECVETKEQYNALYNQGCDDYQGYFFSKPLSANECENMLIQSNTFKSLNGGNLK
jgi:diguanylate cyclase (GGDEF)-like protein